MMTEPGSETSEADLERARQSGRGRRARAPWHIPLEGWKDILWRVFVGISQHRILLLAAGVTFYLLLALVPILSSFVSIYGLFTSPDAVLGQVQLLSGIVPQGGLDVIRVQLLRLTERGDQSLGLTLIISLVVGLWSAGGGVRAIFEAMNVVYHEKEKRNFLAVNATAFLFTVGGMIAAIVVASAIFVIPAVLHLFRLGDIEWLIRSAAYLVMLVIVVLGLNALYRWGPSRRNARWSWVTPGTILAIVASVLASIAFSWYAGNLTDFDATYGSLGSIIGFLLWIWLSMAIVIIGGSLNSEVERQTARDSTTNDHAQPLGHRGAVVADTVGKARPESRIARFFRFLTRRGKD